MNDKQLSDALKAIAQDQIGEIDMWSDIQAQVRPRRRTMTWYVLRAAAAIILLMFALLTATAGYALIQRYFDPGTQNVVDQELVVPVEATVILPTALPVETQQAEPPAAATPVPGETVGESADLGEVTLTLDWIYADPLRVLVAYTLSVPEGQALPEYGLVPQITYADDSFFNHSISPIMQPQDDPSRLSVVVSLEHHEPLTSGQVVDLNVAFQSYPVPDFESGQPSIAVPEIVASFDLSLPVQSVETIAIDETITIDGTAIRLEKVEISAAAVRVSYCYGFPPEPATIDWLPRSTVTIDGRETLPLGGGITVDKGAISVSDTERCWYEDFSANYQEGDGLLRFLVDRLVHMTPESNDPARFARAEERLAAQGIVADFQIHERGWGYEVVSLPDDMTESEAGILVFDALSDIAEGPWVFEIQLP